MGSEKEKDNLEVQMLLHDHAQSSEEARYRDSLILHEFYFSLAVLGAFITAIVRILTIYWLCIVLSVIGAIIFFIFSASLRSIRSARNAAWQRRKEIENDSRLEDFVKTNTSIVERGKGWWEKKHVADWIWRFEFGAFIGWIVVGIIFLVLWTVSLN